MYSHQVYNSNGGLAPKIWLSTWTPMNKHSLAMCKATGIASSTCKHTVMCSDSYPIPVLSLFFLYHPYIPYFLIQRIFHFLVSFLFLLHACMYSHQVYNSNGGLAPKIWLSTWTPMNKHSLAMCKATGIASSTCKHTE